MDADSAHFQCGACGRQLRWKPELAGRDVRCPCGQVSRCPDAPVLDDAMYDLAPEPAKPQPHRPPAGVKSNVSTLSYQTPRKAIPGAAAVTGDTEALKNQYIPLWLLGGGVAVELFTAFVRDRHNLPAAMIVISVEIIGETVLMLIGLFLTAKIRGIQIGTFWSATLRLAAVSIAPSAVGDLVTPIAMLLPLVGGLFKFAVEFALYFALLGVLFDLDQSDTWWCVAVIFLVKLSVVALLLWAPWHR